MNMKRTLIVGLLLASVTAFAYPGPNGGPQPGPDGDMRMPFESLDLTSKQKQQIKTIQREAREARFKLMDQMDDLRDKTREQVMAVLTAEQKKTLEAERKEMMQQRKSAQGCDRGQMPDRGKMPPMQKPQND